MKTIKNKLPYLLLVFVSLISLFPFYMMITMSTFKTEKMFQTIPLYFSDYLLKNLQTVFQSNFMKAYANSMIISIGATLGCTLISAMVGYAIVAYRFRFRNILQKMIMLTMMVPVQLGVVGYMIEMRSMHLTGTLLPMILVWLANGFGAYWMMQYIESSLPLEIIESARVDGSGELRTFFSIVLPCIKPGIVTLVLLIFLWSWNSYLIPLVFVNDNTTMTIPIYIKSLGNAYMTDYAAQITGLAVATIPLLILFIAGSKNFIEGLTAGAVKG